MQKKLTNENENRLINLRNVRKFDKSVSTKPFHMFHYVSIIFLEYTFTKQCTRNVFKNLTVQS